MRMLSHVPLHMFRIDPDRSDIRLSCSHTFTGPLNKHYCVFELMKHIRAPRCPNIVSEITSQFLQASKILWYNLTPDSSRILFLQDKHPADIRGPWMAPCAPWMDAAVFPPFIPRTLCLPWLEFCALQKEKRLYRNNIIRCKPRKIKRI